MYKTIEEFYAARRKPHWPATYTAALLDPLVSRIVAIQWRIYHDPSPAAPEEKPVKVKTRWKSGYTPGMVDLKRLAANDKDD